MTDSVIAVRGLTRRLAGPTPCTVWIWRYSGGRSLGWSASTVGEDHLDPPPSGSVRAPGRHGPDFRDRPGRRPRRGSGPVGAWPEPDIPGWMRVAEAMRFTASFYPTWDPALADELLAAFHLDPTKKVNTLWAGLHARLALLLAVTHPP